MATKQLSTCFFSCGWGVPNCRHSNVRFCPLPSHRLHPASCKMRHRNYSSQQKRPAKKVTPERLPTNANIQPNVGKDSELEDSELETLSTDDISSLKYEDKSTESVDTIVAAEDINERDLNTQTMLLEIKPSLVDADGGEELSSVHLQDLIGMIRNAEKNILLLNQARVRALEDLEMILNDKHALQAQINILEIRLAETDARIKVAAQEKIHVELLEEELQKLQKELVTGGRTGGNMQDAHEEIPLPHTNSVHSFSEELSSLKKENMSLKDDLEALKKELSDVKGNDERVLMLEKERSLLEYALKELEIKLSASQEDVSKLSNLKFECKSLWEKVEHLQALLDKSTKQADQAISVLQQNQELRKKVDRLEESLDEANVYKSSSEKLQQYNELMQQKIKLLEERLQRSDEEIHSYVQLYQESVKEFQDTLNSLKEESKRRALDGPVNDMPWEFWSRLLLMIDGWFLEKKISTDDARLLREMVWKRDGHICEAYMACKEKNEHEAIATFVRLTSSPKRAGLHVIHIAAEMAPVAKVGGLGDVVTGLGKALQKRGHLVEIVLPKYDCMEYDRIRDLRALDVVIESYFDGRLFKNKVWVGVVEGLPVYFIEPHHPSNFFWRGQLYGEHDDFKRFSFFSRAALELLLQTGKKPDIIHCHDWQTSFVAPLYWDLYAPNGLNSARICFTCHNFEYQGSAPASQLASCGLDVHQLNRPDRMQDNLAHDRVNAVKGAIVFSNIVTTVSPTYAQEVRTAEGGKGLHMTLNSHSKKFIGILNGIDTDAWNPATDSFLIKQGFENCEADLEAGSRICFSKEQYRLESGPFTNLKILEDIDKNAVYSTQKGHVNAASSSVVQIVDSTCEDNHLETTTFPTSSLANDGISLGSYLQSYGSHAPNAPLYENSAPTRPSYDLNSPPRILSCSGSDIPSQFSPITPDLSKKAEDKEAHDILVLNVGERANQEREKQGNNLDTSEFEIEELPKDFACAAVSTQLQESHNPDKAGNLAIDLNSTPQQKERRRKHRPKVVKEGQKKRTRKPASPADTPTVKRKYVRKNKVDKTSSTPTAEATSTTTDIKPAPPTGKRKYVRKNKIDKTPGTPTVEATSRTTDIEPAPPAAKSCKRKLNFDSKSQLTEEDCPSSRLQSNANAESESHAQNSYTRVESNSNEYTRVGIAYEHMYPVTKVVEYCTSNQERRAPNPQTPNRTELRHEHLRGRDQDAPVEGKCQIVFSDETHDERERIIQGMSYEGEQAKGLQRGKTSMGYEVEHTRTNVIGCNFSAVHQYWAMFPEDIHTNVGIPGIYFPANYKRKRIEKGQSSTTSSTLSNVTFAENSVGQGIPWSMTNACAAYSLENDQFISSSISTNTVSVIAAQGKERTSECRLALNQKGKISKKRAKDDTPRGMFGSLIEYVECRPKPTFPAEGAPTMGVLQGYEVFNHPPACVDAPMKMKNPKKRKPFAGLEAIQKIIPSPNEIAEQLKRLDINNQEQRSLVPCYFRYEDQNALVVYQGHGTVVPFEGPFDPVRKRKPRPKVDLDEETTRVWKLLLENINSEGIDGTDEEKAKWWEEERRVFRGRADSFIARMHLVQGDRRFSPWKGSVLDSVIGVFLTQNVSDHLSSSAFMALAAHFPLKSKSSERPCFVKTSVFDEETEVCTMDPENTIKWQWHEEKSNQPACNRSSVTFNEMDYFSEKVLANSNESLGSSMDGEKSVDNWECKTSDISRDGLEIYDESTADGKVIQLKQAVSSSTGDNREVDDVVSSQHSSGSSQNSVNSSMTQAAERIGSFFHDNSEAADHALRGNLKSLVSSSFMELLRSQEERSYNHKTGNVSAGEANGYSCTEHDKQNQSVQEVQELPNLSRETLDATESNSVTSKPKNTDHKEVEPCLMDRGYHSGIAISGKSSDSSNVKRDRIGEQKQNTEDWDSLRLQAQVEGKSRERTTNTMDSLDWEAVRCADVNEIAYTIRERGMNNRLAARIKDFLNRLVQDHGSIDLEWLRDVPPDKAKEYLLSVKGLGLKSVECVRLLTLHHLAFPVDTNVGRIAVRLGWVPLQPLPESLQLHLLELYPVLESIQRYLWPRLCKLDQRTLYELHYQMITFGKVFCTKSKPNCNACPLRGECRHFASAFASARLALPGPEEKSIVSATESKAAGQPPVEVFKLLQLPLPQANQQLVAHSQINNNEPIVEMPASPEPTIEVPAMPELEQPEVLERDIEDAFFEDPEEIPMIKLDIEEFTQNLQHYMQQNLELQEGDISKALVALTPEAASIPVPKLKYINRLRTEHQVYELPDSHPLLEGLDNREPDDPSSYLLAIWTPGETANSIEPSEKSCGSQEFGQLCDENTCFSCNSIRETNSQIVRGTILIPCRTAMRGSFPLNGTYFQVNEVFADHESSINPIAVPRAWIWNLPRRTVFFGTSIPTIFRGLSTESIQYCFWRGFVCVRGFELKTRAPRPLLARLHFPASKLKASKGDTNAKQE